MRPRHLTALTIDMDIMLIRMLVFWYCKQTCCVRWGNLYSPLFTVSNGVHQGGIMSPVLCNSYMDDLSVCLNNSKIGCSGFSRKTEGYELSLFAWRPLLVMQCRPLANVVKVVNGVRMMKLILTWFVKTIAAVDTFKEVNKLN